LPPWLSETLWQAFLEHRRKLRAPMTLKAQELAIAKLERFRNAGIDPAATIEASIENGWKGLFEPKQHNTPRSGISEWLSRQTEADEREITGERIA
jgi:hypothetical protein